MLFSDICPLFTKNTLPASKRFSVEQSQQVINTCLPFILFKRKLCLSLSSSLKTSSNSITGFLPRQALRKVRQTFAAPEKHTFWHFCY